MVCIQTILVSGRSGELDGTRSPGSLIGMRRSVGRREEEKVRCEGYRWSRFVVHAMSCRWRRPEISRDK